MIYCGMSDTMPGKFKLFPDKTVCPFMSDSNNECVVDIELTGDPQGDYTVRFNTGCIFFNYEKYKTNFSENSPPTPEIVELLSKRDQNPSEFKWELPQKYCNLLNYIMGTV